MRKFVLLSSFVAFSACFCAPQKAGDACDLNADDEPCPDGLTCQELDGGGKCLVIVGNACDADADEAFCADGSACAGDDPICGGRGGACEEAAQCGGGNTCADIQGAEARCEPNLFLRGLVVDGIEDTPLDGANIIALDPLGSAITKVAISDADGRYSLEVSATRDSDGSPADGAFVTLRAAAQDYATFPGGVRTALPIDLDVAVESDGAFVVESAVTSIALLPLPDDEQGRPAISGAIAAGEQSDGVLVVAEGDEAFSAVSDSDGGFIVFNVAPGNYTLRGYARGVQLVPVDLSVADDDVEDVVLDVADTPLGSVTGDVNIVNAPGSSQTSVVLVVRSTFDPILQRGEVPRGLRAPESGPPTLDGAFVISGVPDGDYIVLAAFENDLLVRDPDESIGGTSLVEVSVPSGGERDVQMPESFKITEALEIFSPGADGIEIVDAPPTFVWADDSGEEFFRLTVFDAFGDIVWEVRLDGVSGDAEVAQPYEGPALEAGMVYQFRVISGKVENDNSETPISMTEDLKGVFQFEP